MTRYGISSYKTRFLFRYRYEMALKRVKETSVENFSQKSHSNKTIQAVDIKSATFSEESIPFNFKEMNVISTFMASREALSAKAKFARLSGRVADDCDILLNAPERFPLSHGIFQCERERQAEEYDALLQDYATATKDETDSSDTNTGATLVNDFICEEFSLGEIAVSSICAAYPSRSGVMVCSSAYEEVFETMSGAGLSDTTINMSISNPQYVERAIENVRASI